MTEAKVRKQGIPGYESGTDYVESNTFSTCTRSHSKTVWFVLCKVSLGTMSGTTKTRMEIKSPREVEQNQQLYNMEVSNYI